MRENIKGVYRFRVSYMESDGAFTVDYPEYLMPNLKEIKDYIRHKKQDLELSGCKNISIQYELIRSYEQE